MLKKTLALRDQQTAVQPRSTTRQCNNNDKNNKYKGEISMEWLKKKGGS